MAETEQTIEATGNDVEAAIANGLADLGVDRDAVEIEILEEGGRGLFGLRAQKARVRLTVKPHAGAHAEPSETSAPPTAEPDATKKEEARAAQEALIELLAFMDMEGAQVEVRRAEPAPGETDPPLILDVHGGGTDALIGHRGQTLADLQHITRLIVGQEMMRWVHLVIDIEGFKARREKSLRRLAKRLAEQTANSDQTVMLEPMPPHERRIIHLALRDDPNVTTQSIGEGDQRKVTIIPQRQ